MTVQPIDRSGEDCMGYSREQQLAGYTDDDIEAARLLAKEAGYEWDCVFGDPAVTGARFLKSAKIVRVYLEGRSVAQSVDARLFDPTSHEESPPCSLRDPEDDHPIARNHGEGGGPRS